MHPPPLFAALATLLLALSPATASASDFLAPYLIDFETGPLYIGKNENQYGTNGTRFTASDVGQQNNLFLSKRLSIELPVSPRNQFIFTWAPLDVPTRATLDRAIDFNDVVFPAGTVVDSRYLFDGYRLTYLYAPLQGEQFLVQIGLALQIRNAQVALDADGALYAQESDIGLVGAPALRVFWDPFKEGGPYWMLDALAFSTFGLFGVTGGIYDVALTFATPITEGAHLTFRARTIGGGADVPDKQISNWASFVSFDLGLRLALGSLFD